MRDILSWSSKVGIIPTGRVLYRDGDTVIAATALAEVVVLEVEGCGFGINHGYTINSVH